MTKEIFKKIVENKGTIEDIKLLLSEYEKELNLIGLTKEVALNKFCNNINFSVPLLKDYSYKNNFDLICIFNKKGILISMKVN